MAVQTHPPALAPLLAEVASRGRLNGATQDSTGKWSEVECHRCGKSKADISLAPSGELVVGCFVCDADITRPVYAQSFREEYDGFIPAAPTTALTIRAFRDTKFPTFDTMWFPTVGVQEMGEDGIIFSYWREPEPGGIPMFHMNRERLYLEPPTDYSTSHKKPPKVKTPKGKKHILYGEWMLPGWRARADGITPYVFVVEGESDALTMWGHGYAALGAIGANGINLDRDADRFLGFEQIVVFIDNDASGVGERPATTLAGSTFADKVVVVEMPKGISDVNALYRFEPATFTERLAQLTAHAMPVTQWVKQNPAQFFGSTLGGRGTRFVAKAMADHLRSEHEFAVGEDGGLLRYADGVWLQDGDRWIEEEAARLLGPYYEPDYVNKAVTIFKHAGSFNRIPFSPPVEERTFIHCRSGIIDVLEAAAQGASYKPEPSSPSRAWLASVPWEYDPTATCPQIDNFLAVVLPLDSLFYFYELLGYGCQFRQSLRRALLFHGPGSNGKSLTTRFMRSLYGGENVSAMSLKKITSDRFAVAGLVGKLANICADIGPSLPKDISVFKEVTGGDYISAERKYRDPFEFYSGAFPVFSCNDWPRSVEADKAFFQRWEVIPCEQVFPENAEKENAIAALMENEDEMRGLFKHAVDGAARLAERKTFDPPPMSAAAKQAWIDSTTGPV